MIETFELSSFKKVVISIISLFLHLDHIPIIADIQFEINMPKGVHWKKLKPIVSKLLFHDNYNKSSCNIFVIVPTASIDRECFIGRLIIHSRNVLLFSPFPKKLKKYNKWINKIIWEGCFIFFKVPLRLKFKWL
jgi:hypothetical protein